MPAWQTVALVGFCVLAPYALFVGALVLSGRRAAARDVARSVPDCVVLLGRLLADERVPRSPKVVLGALLLYLLTPIDLVPDFIPVAGQADDAILVVLVLRGVLRSVGSAVLRDHWPGSERSLVVLLRLTSNAPASSSGRDSPGRVHAIPPDRHPTEH